MRICLRSISLCLALASAQLAYGGLIAADPSGATDITSYGFGVVPPVMTLQNDSYESVCVVPTETLSCPSGSPDWSSFDPIVGDVSGTKKYSSPTVADLSITGFADVGILFNVNEPNNVEEVTLHDLRIGFFDTDGNLVVEFALESPTDFSNISQGQGSAGFLITITDAQATAAAGLFSSDLVIGMAARIGCDAALGACDVAGNFSTGDGPESFTVVSLANPPPPPQLIPEPSTAALVGLSGLLLWFGARQRRK